MSKIGGNVWRNVTAGGAISSISDRGYRSAGLHKYTLCKESRREIKATRCENETAEPRSVFWTIGQRRRKESAGNLKGTGAKERDRDSREREKKQARKSFPLVERNTHRFATIQRFALALHCKVAHYATRFFSYPIVRSIGVGAR